MKSYEDLTFVDDFMFCKILTEYPQLCRELLQIIIGKKVGDFVSIDKQKPIEITTDGKGIRFDVYIEDDTKTVYDIEMQTTLPNNAGHALAKRCRYYQGMINFFSVRKPLTTLVVRGGITDLNTIQRGDDYTKLNNSYIIFILLKDPFKNGLAKYTFQKCCLETPTLYLDDGTTEIFLNASSRADDVTKELKDFLQFIAGRKPSNRFTHQLNDCVNEAKAHRKWRTEFMTLQMKLLEQKEEGREEGRTDGIASLCSLIVTGKITIDEAVEAAKSCGIQNKVDFLNKAAQAGYVLKVN